MTALDALWPILPRSLRAEAQHEAARGLATCERHTAQPALRWLQERRPVDPGYEALGVLNPEARVDAFYAAVETLVLPRLTRLGLDGAKAWRDRYRTP